MTPEARQRRQLRRPVLAITATAWAATVAVHLLPAGSGHDMDGMAMAGHPQAAHAMGRHGGDATLGSSLTPLTGWPLMLTAMMAPLLLPALRHVYARSLPSRRWRALTLVTAIYAATWSAGGLLLDALATGLRAGAGQGGTAVAFGVSLAVLWQLSPLKQRCLNRYHAHPPLAAFGRAADLDVLRFGGAHGLWCLGSCWALMLLPLLSGGSELVVMAIVALWIWAERFDPPAVPAWQIRLPVQGARIVAAAIRSLPRPQRVGIGAT
jgi:predicted metal-binding membrane protein